MDTELILSITTIGISALALYMSISTAKKQNKIALFEKKIDCYNDLNIYFEGRSIFASAEVKLLGGEARFNNGYKGNKDHLFSQIRLLFDNRIWKSVEETDDLYRIIHEGNSRVGTYFSLLDEDPNGYEVLDIIKEYIEREAQDWQYPITEDEENEFKSFCTENAITYNNPIDGNVRLNYYDLKSIQHDAYMEISKKQKDLISDMEEEIKVSK